MRERESRKTSQTGHIFHSIISVENLLVAWQEFLRGKRKRKDVAEFSLHILDHIVSLHHELARQSYRHGSYQAFSVNDSKPRDIHKASVRDRLLHHAIYRVLYPFFDRKFIFDSYSCRKDKGTHRAINRFRIFGRKVSKNYTQAAWVLKGYIRKFFASIDHEILIAILRKYIDDASTLWLLGEIITSFSIGTTYKGLPLGNLTSQLLVNIYMNEFDQFVKRKLKVTCYIRYADDFVIFHTSKRYLTAIIPQLQSYLHDELKLTLHPDKLFIKPLSAGIDFLGWVHFPHHRVLRTATKRRMFNKLQQNNSKESLASYRGLLKYGNTYKILLKLYELYSDNF